VRSGGVAGDELNDDPAVRGLVSGDPAHVEPLDAEPEVVHVEVVSFTMSGTGRFAVMPVASTSGSFSQ
jgi:hypothetical protein